MYEVIKKNEKKNDIIKVEIGYYFLQSGEYNECDSICTLKISLYYIYKFMCEDKNCCYTAKSLPYTSCFDWIRNKSHANVMSMHKSISQYHLFNTYICIYTLYICIFIYMIVDIVAVLESCILVENILRKGNWKCHFY